MKQLIDKQITVLLLLLIIINLFLTYNINALSSSFRTLHRRRNNINDKRHGNQLQLTPIVDQIETDYNNNGNNDVSDGKIPINGLKRSYTNAIPQQVVYPQQAPMQHQFHIDGTIPNANVRVDKKAGLAIMKTRQPTKLKVTEYTNNWC